MSYKIYKKCISEKSSEALFKFVLKTCNFYSPSTFKNMENYPKKWIDPNFISKIRKLRKNSKKKFSAIYNSVQVSNELQKIPYDNNFEIIAQNFLKIKKDQLLVRGIQFRMDFPNDIRNSYGWHQDNAYDRHNVKSENGVVLWLPLIDTNQKNGTLIVKPGSECSSFNCSKKISKGTKYKSQQILVMKKFLKKYNSKSINVKKNCCLATYCGIFHKSGLNTSDQIRFTLIVRYNNQFSKDFVFYRNLK